MPPGNVGSFQTYTSDFKGRKGSHPGGEGGLRLKSIGGRTAGDPVRAAVVPVGGRGFNGATHRGRAAGAVGGERRRMVTR